MLNPACRCALVILALCALPALADAADGFFREDLRIPMAATGSRGLEATLVRPDAPGRFPLALINHGSPRTRANASRMTPSALLPQALEFARRGWAAVILMRRGYGESGGGFAESFGSCNHPDYLSAGRASAADLKAAIVALAGRADIDGSRVISVGHSAGGFATVALTADPPPGLAAGISFAGGRGSQSDDEVCDADRLVAAFATFGQHSRIPMLWVYAENDRFFGPRLAQKFKDAFSGAGGHVEFVKVPPFGADGHSLFSASGISVWPRYVDAFLAEHRLTARASLLARPSSPMLTPPPQLSGRGRQAFETYLMSGPHKAFAVSPDGHFGWRTGQRTVDDARAGALENCHRNASDCEIVFVDSAAVR
ncbi:MAG TPA: CocE/NonD family hydrolase [Pseudolabrys sp.]|nr:CocE/NonD family hydrolase [Pseudolabrys sp.]